MKNHSRHNPCLPNPAERDHQAPVERDSTASMERELTAPVERNLKVPVALFPACAPQGDSVLFRRKRKDLPQGNSVLFRRKRKDFLPEGILIFVVVLLFAGFIPLPGRTQETGDLSLLTPEERIDPEMVKAVMVTLVEEKRPDLALPYMALFLAMGDRNGASPAELVWIYLNRTDGFRALGREDEALASLQEAVAQSRKIGDCRSRDYQDFLFGVGNNLYETGHPAEAEPLYLELLRADTLFEQQEREPSLCLNLFTWYGETGQYHKLRPVLEKMMPWLETISTSAQQAGNYHTLGVLYTQEGQYDKAEKHLLKAVSLYGEAPAAEVQAARVSMELALVYMKMGDAERALRVAEEARRSTAAGSDTLTQRLYESIRAVHAIHKKDYQQALVLYSRLVETAPRGGIHEADYASDLGTLATIHWYLHDYDQAANLYQQAIDLYRATQDTTWGHYANLKGNLGLVYLRRCDFERAAAWASSAVASYSALGREEHPDCLTHRINRSIALEGAGAIDTALTTSLANNHSLISLVEKNLLYWSEHEMESFMAGFATRFFDYHHALWFRHQGHHPEMTGQIYNNQLFLKGILLQSALKLQQAVTACNDTLLWRLAAEQKSLRATLEELLALPPVQRHQDPTALQNREELLLKKMKERVTQLPRSGHSSFGMLTAAETSFREVRQALRPGEAAIEFVSFRNADPWHESDTTWYCALVLRKEDPWPLLRFLTTGDRLEQLLALHPDELYSAENNALTPLLWKPLEKELQGITTLYYSPSGLLHRIAFAALPINEGKVLSDQVKLINLASTRSLVHHEDPEKPTSGMIFGGIDYNTVPPPAPSGQAIKEPETTTVESEPATEESGQGAEASGWTAEARSSGRRGGEDQQQEPQAVQEGWRSLRGNAWEFLPGTKVEAEGISRLLEENRLPATTHTGSDATEERFKALTGHAPAIIHMASHGFSLPPAGGDPIPGEMKLPTAQEMITASGIPLMRSGLLLAGANQAWVNGIRLPGRDDGILTAWEISHLDLSSTALAVLSACQTGLGEIRGSEGVYGLQRALFMAGTHSIIVSLWEVPDLETMELMDHFYNHLVRGSDPETAFLKAQNELKETYRDQPSLWAGFVFIR